MSASQRTVRIAPSILAADFARLADEVAAIEAAGADVVHVDVMDGHFVPNLSIGLPVIRALKRVTRLPLDVHLMITNADDFLARYAEAGADWLSVHPEACLHLDRTLATIRELGCRAGVALNPHTGLDALTWVGDRLDHVLLMSVNPGFGGQRFIPRSVDKIRAVREWLDREAPDATLGVDGGVNTSNAELVRRAGADVLVAGSAVFRADDYRVAIAALRGDSV